jgi:hypothetical protein
MTNDDDRPTAGEDAPGANEEIDVEKAQSDANGMLSPRTKEDETEDEEEPVGAIDVRPRRPRKDSTMPPVQEVLKRTTSLSQASVQG